MLLQSVQATLKRAVKSCMDTGQGDLTFCVSDITLEKNKLQTQLKTAILQLEAHSKICCFTMVEKHMGFQLAENSLFL